MDYYFKDTKNCIGLGVFAGRPFQAGEWILTAVGQLVSEQTMFSIQVDWDWHLDVEPPARFLNHSCNPNAGVRMKEQLTPMFIALREIAKDEEITFDYAMTEFMHYPRNDPRLEFDLSCACGSPECRGKMGYYSELSEELKQKYQGFFAPYLLSEPPPAAMILVRSQTSAG